MARGEFIESRAKTTEVRRAYDGISHVYDLVVSPLESKPRRRALEWVNVRDGERVLEVAVGTGLALREILRRSRGSGWACGVDLSWHMIRRARRKTGRAGFTHVPLLQADTRALPFADGSFDLLFNAYMLDLIPIADMDVVLGEYRRVLRPEGRIVLLNLTKEGKTSIWERLYRIAPGWAISWVFGGCRPVRMAPLLASAGFRDVRREYIHHWMPSEVLIARA